MTSADHMPGAPEEAASHDATLMGNDGIVFRDHFSLGESTQLRFRGKKVHVINDVGRDQQLAIFLSKQESEPTEGDSQRYTVETRVNATGTFGTALLRTLCSLVSFFVLTVLFAFSIQCLIFLFMNVVGTYTKDSWTNDPPVMNMLGCVLACPILLVSLGALMSMSWACTVDCWRGLASHPTSLWKTTQWLGIGRSRKRRTWRSHNHREWTFLVVFLGIPSLVCGITSLQSAADNFYTDWYSLTMLSWFGSVLGFQIIYMESIFWNEMVVCYRMLKSFAPLVVADHDDTSFGHLILTNLILTQRQKYSAYRKERYLLEGHWEPDAIATRASSFSEDRNHNPVQFKYSLGTRLMRFLPILYDTLDCQEKDAPSDNNNSKQKSKRNYTIFELFGNVTINTKSNWSLERLWCMDPRRVTAFTVIKGDGSITSFQLYATYACFSITMVLILFVLVGFFEWRGKPLKDTFVIILFVVLVCFLPMIISIFKVRQYETTRTESFDQDPECNEIKTDTADGNTSRGYNEGNEADDCCEVFVSVWETVRIMELKPFACVSSAVAEIILLYLWPVTSLFYFENTPVAVIFLIAGLHTIPRHYFNVSNLLQELGPLDRLDLGDLDMSLFSGKNDAGRVESGSKAEKLRLKNRRNMKNKALVANLIQRVTRTRANGHWIGTFFFFFIVIFIGYYVSSSEPMFAYEMGRYKWKGVVYADNFYWDPQPQLPYPTCTVEKGFSVDGQRPTMLADYSFLATLAFSSAAEAQPLLDQWFGNGTVIDDSEYVTSYRKSTGTEDHPVAYKLFTFANNPTAGVIGIRGSEAMWDWMVDMQLWAGGIFAQLIKNTNPFGGVWEPILDELVFLINSPQSQKLKEVSYYRYTSEFVETLYNGFGDRQFDTLRVTGASLGGGLAILTGAITGASAISFSGLNAMYSRRTFLPPITEEDLNTRVFNTIPQRDFIANIDKPGLLYQRMQCNAPTNNLFACHSMFRSLCEIQYRCGSQGRPINCWCVSNYGYPAPTQNGTKTWEDTCSEASVPPS